MTRFTLYHTVTDTLGRVKGELYDAVEQIQVQPETSLKTHPTSLKGGGENKEIKKTASTVEHQILDNTRKRRLARLNERKRKI